MTLLMKDNALKTLFRLSPIAAILPFAAFGAGFQLNEHSANGLGRAFAGEAAVTDEASVIARNPAAMSKFDRTSFSLVMTYINPEVEVKGTSTASSAATFNESAVPLASMFGADIAPLQAEHEVDEKDIAPSAFIPAIYLIVPVNDKWAWGVAGFSNYGLSTDYSGGFNGLEYADKTELITFNVNASLSYTISDQLSIGVGLDAVYADAEIYTSTPGYMDDYLPSLAQFNALVPTINGTLGEGTVAEQPLIPGGLKVLRLKGDDWGWGWNAGILWEPTIYTDIALTYHSEVDLTLEGDISSQVQATLNSSGSLDLTLPSTAELAINQQFAGSWSVQASARFTNWSSFKRLEADTDVGTIPIKEEHWKDAWRYAVGIGYQVSPDWQLRAGFAIDKTPVRAQYRTISIPDADRKWFSLGTSYQFSKQLGLDVGYSYLKGDKVDVHEQSALGTTLDAKLAKADAHILSAQLNYRF